MEFYIGTLKYASYLLVIIPIVFYLVNVKKIKSDEIHYIGILTIASGLSDLIGFVLKQMGLANAVVYNTYTVVEFIIFNLFYYLTFFKKSYKKAVIISAVCFFIALLIFVKSPEVIFTNLNFMWIITALITFVYSISYTIKFFLGKSNEEFNGAIFLINVGILLYTSLILLPFSIPTSLFNEYPDIWRFIYSFARWGNILRNVFVSIGIIIWVRQNSAKR
jgi:hypothetical protein